MRVLTGLFAGVLLTLGSMSASATLVGGVPACVDLTALPTPPEVFCNAVIGAQLNSTTGFSFSVLFGGPAYVETLLSNPLEVDFFYSPNGFFGFPVAQVLTVSSFALLDSAGNDLGILFNPYQLIAFDTLRFNSAGVVPANTRIFGYSLTMTCDNTVSPHQGVCDTGLRIGQSAIAMNALPNQPSLRVGREVVGAVPVPATAALFGIALAGLGWSLRRR